MNKRQKPLWKNKLAVKLLAASALSLILAAGAALSLRLAVYNALDEKLASAEFAEEDAALLRLQGYIDKNKLAKKDIAKLDEWREDYLSFAIYTDDGKIYDSAFEHGAQLNVAEYIEFDDSYDYTLQFSDGKAYVILFSYRSFAYYSAADWASAGVGLVLFLLLMALFVNKKLRYLSKLTDEAAILEGGDLTYPITVMGGDELGELARGIDDMRKAILERQQGETEAKSANRELITAMSHDLRTPLTSLLGYLDLMELGKYENAAQLAHFIKSSREKGYRIKQLSDKLFEYFLVYASDWSNTPSELVDIWTYLSQMISENAFELEVAGFLVSVECEPFRAVAHISTELMQRVFENTFGNIKKYAAKNSPVKIACAFEDAMRASNGMRVRITIVNEIKSERGRVESTGLGIKTCEKLMRFHGGSFSASEEAGKFCVSIELPVKT